MASVETLIFDAAGSNIDGTDPGSALTVGWGTSYRLFECEYPPPPHEVQYASSVDTEGELPVSRRYGNRVITLKFKLVGDTTGALVAALQAKYTKFQREGGTLKRTMTNGDVRIYDIIAGDGWNRAYDYAFYVAGLTVVEMTLPARPLSRGVEVDLGDNTETTLPALVFTEATVAGDTRARARLVIDEDQAQAQRTVIWGIQSRYYDATATAGLFFQAEALTAGSITTPTVGPAGSSGGGSNTMFYGSLASPPTSPLQALIAHDTTHVGRFRVFARVQVPNTNTGTVSCQLQYTVRNGSQVVNEMVAIDPTYEAAWVIVDLGEMNATPPPKGSQDIEVLFAAGSTVTNDDIYFDWVMYVPVDEGYGEISSPSATVYPLVASGHLEVTTDGVVKSTSAGTVWGKPEKVEGDYLLVPPSGAEARTLRVIVKATRGAIIRPSNPSPAVGVDADSAIDDISAKLFVTPRYLT
jgi:hypothetical protein